MVLGLLFVAAFSSGLLMVTILAWKCILFGECGR